MESRQFSFPFSLHSRGLEKDVYCNDVFILCSFRLCFGCFSAFAVFLLLHFYKTHKSQNLVCEPPEGNI